MSMVINLVEDHNIYLCEGGPVYNGGVQPTPITYLTQWRMMGNSTVHTDPYLTQWKVSGNSIVDNNVILSCGDLGQDGKYHVKISNGVTIYDIPLTEPLRKVNNVADSIEFADGVATLTRNLAKVILSDLTWFASANSNTGKYKYSVYSLLGIIKLAKDNATPGDILCNIYDTVTANGAYATNLEGIAVESVQGSVYLYDANYNQEGNLNAFLEHIQGAEMVYALATPTTETIQVSPFPISPTDTYTSANDTPYSAFEYKKNVEIWSCGEYSAVDSKYHILVQPLGGSIADIALDEPLRKVNDVADTIEFVNGVATVTRYYKRIEWQTVSISKLATSGGVTYFGVTPATPYKMGYTENQLSNAYPNYKRNTATAFNGFGMGLGGSTALPIIRIVNSEMENMTVSEFATANAAAGIEIIYELATPTTETIQVPQIAEADSYSCVISQGGKAVEWSSFTTE